MKVLFLTASYPTPDDALSLGQIPFLRERYPNVAIGYSTHESPTNFDAIRVAIGAGATIFEKHIGIPTAEHPLNGYSATPAQVAAWLGAAANAFALRGVEGRRPDFDASELASLRELRRGVWAKRASKAGERVVAADVDLAIPVQPGQLTANDLSKYVDFVLLEDVEAGQPVLASQVQRVDHRQRIGGILGRVKALLRTSGVLAPRRADFEISHHYGIDRFEEWGATLINVVNREYCKKLIVMLPAQKHPEQYHERKEETFHVLHGTIDLTLDGVHQRCKPGDVVTVERGVHHSFSSPDGAILEEISSTHFRDDSYYTDPAIAANANRKTLVTYWID